MKIGDRIIQIAEEFEGLVEVISNAEWDDPKTKGKDSRAAKFEEVIKGRGGHADGAPYCMAFAEAVWNVAYEDLKAPADLRLRIRSLLSPSVMNSFTNCQKAGLISEKPERGAILFMQNGKGWTGHAGLVVSADSGWIHTIEANTSPSDPNERDGGAGTGGVFRKRRLIDFTSKSKGLWLRGFLNPIYW